ncbi:hypothetical protein HK405_002060 [Cladochytrium tenue]|nr:hypothetical protein HK405_002060 [Cladochytrium tenue]
MQPPGQFGGMLPQHMGSMQVMSDQSSAFAGRTFPGAPGIMAGGGGSVGASNAGAIPHRLDMAALSLMHSGALGSAAPMSAQVPPSAGAAAMPPPSASLYGNPSSIVYGGGGNPTAVAPSPALHSAHFQQPQPHLYLNSQPAARQSFGGGPGGLQLNRTLSSGPLPSRGPASASFPPPQYPMPQLGATAAVRPGPGPFEAATGPGTAAAAADGGMLTMMAPRRPTRSSTPTYSGASGSVRRGPLSAVPQTADAAFSASRRPNLDFM